VEREVAMAMESGLVLRDSARWRPTGLAADVTDGDGSSWT